MNNDYNHKQDKRILSHQAGYYIFILITAGLFLRLYNIYLTPPFADETGNILTALNDNIRRIVSPNAQARPLLSVLFYPAELIMTLGIYDNILINARVMVVFAGVSLLLIAITIICKYFNQQTALYFTLIWYFNPLIVLHERLALQEAFTAFFILGSLGTYLFLPAKIGVIFAGFLFGIACLNKITAIIALPWYLGFLFICYGKRSGKNFGAWLAGFALISFPFFLRNDFATKMIQLGHTESLESLNHSGFDPYRIVLVFSTGVQKLSTFFTEYNGTAVLVLVFASWFYILFYMPRLRPLLFGSVVSIILICFAYSAKSYGRYLYVETFPLIILIAASCDDIIRKKSYFLSKAVTVFFILLLPMAQYTVKLWPHYIFHSTRDLSDHYIPSDHQQYISSWWSGDGIPELLDYINSNLIKKDSRTLFIDSKCLENFPHLFSPALAAISLNAIEASNKNISWINSPSYCPASFFQEIYIKAKSHAESVYLIREPVNNISAKNDILSQMKSIGIESQLIKQIERPLALTNFEIIEIL